MTATGIHGRCLCPACLRELRISPGRVAGDYRCPGCDARLLLSWYHDALGTPRPMLTERQEVAW